MKSNRVIRAAAYFLSPDQGGRKTPAFSGHRPTVRFCDWPAPETPGYFDSELTIEGSDSTPPGQPSVVRLRLLHPEHVEEPHAGAAFGITEGRRVIGTATVIEVIDDDASPRSAPSTPPPGGQR